MRCAHCGHLFLKGETRVEGREGVYCQGTCRYDHEVLGVDPEDVPPKRD